MISKQEKSILRLIQIVPALLITIFFVSIMLIIINGKIENGKQDIKDLKNNILQTIKDEMKSEVDMLYRHISYKRKTAHEELKKELVEHVDIAYSISLNIYKTNPDKNITEITHLIKEALRPIRFNDGRGYFFIYDMDYKNILLPIAPELEGKDFSKYRDIKGDMVVKNMATLCKKNGSTFYTWYWKKPNDGFKGFKKIGYARYFKPFEWFIGTGEYMVDFQNNLKANIKKEIKDTRYTKKKDFFIISYNDKNSLYKKMIDLAKRGGGFLENKDKIYFIKGMKKWNWVIGEGEDLKKIKNSLKKEELKLQQQLHYTVLKLLLIFIVIALILFAVSLYIVKRSKKIFLRYKKVMIHQAEKSKKRLLLIQHQNKLAALGEMLGNISHQWKQPLNALGISVSKLLLLENENILTKEVLTKNLNRMEKNISYLSQTIDIFRDFFKPISCVEEFRVDQEVMKLIDIMTDFFKENFINCSFECKDDIVIKGDRKKLEQALMNILNNAKDALVDNKIENKKIDIKIYKKDNKAIIAIKDNGGGIPKNIKNKIFEPYFTTKDNKNGTGVGLYMTKIIIENHFRGKIKFKNEDDGVEFIITLPLKIS